MAKSEMKELFRRLLMIMHEYVFDVFVWPWLFGGVSVEGFF